MIIGIISFDCLLSDYITFNNLVGALILTMVIPMFTAVTGQEYRKSSRAFIYVLLLAICGVLEAISVLLCIRNLLVISLIDAENMTEFITISADILMMPMRINFVAVLSMVVSLLFYSLWQYGFNTTMVFFFAVILPCLLHLLHYIGKGIANFNAVQGWTTRKEEMIQSDHKVGPEKTYQIYE